MFKFYLHIHTYEQPFTCCICKKSFRQSHNLKLHLHIHTGEGLFTCDICKKSVKQSGTLKFHLHAHNEECPFMCAMCKKSFKQPDGLKMLECDHLLVVFCRKSFKQFGAKEVHLHTYTLSCSLCVIYVRIRWWCPMHWNFEALHLTKNLQSWFGMTKFF